MTKTYAGTAGSVIPLIRVIQYTEAWWTRPKSIVSDCAVTGTNFTNLRNESTTLETATKNIRKSGRSIHRGQAIGIVMMTTTTTTTASVYRAVCPQFVLVQLPCTVFLRSIAEKDSSNSDFSMSYRSSSRAKSEHNKFPWKRNLSVRSSNLTLIPT